MQTPSHNESKFHNISTSTQIEGDNSLTQTSVKDKSTHKDPNKSFLDTSLNDSQQNPIDQQSSVYSVPPPREETTQTPRMKGDQYQRAQTNVGESSLTTRQLQKFGAMKVSSQNKSYEIPPIGAGSVVGGGMKIGQISDGASQANRVSTQRPDQLSNVRESSKISHDSLFQPMPPIKSSTDSRPMQAVIKEEALMRSYRIDGQQKLEGNNSFNRRKSKSREYTTYNKSKIAARLMGISENEQPQPTSAGNSGVQIDSTTSQAEGHINLLGFLPQATFAHSKGQISKSEERSQSTKIQDKIGFSHQRNQPLSLGFNRSQNRWDQGTEHEIQIQLAEQKYGLHALKTGSEYWRTDRNKYEDRYDTFIQKKKVDAVRLSPINSETAQVKKPLINWDVGRRKNIGRYERRKWIQSLMTRYPEKGYEDIKLRSKIHLPKTTTNAGLKISTQGPGTSDYNQSMSSKTPDIHRSTLIGQTFSQEKPNLQTSLMHDYDLLDKMAIKKLKKGGVGILTSDPIGLKLKRPKIEMKSLNAQLELSQNKKGENMGVLIQDKSHGKVKEITPQFLSTRDQLILNKQKILETRQKKSTNQNERASLRFEALSNHLVDEMELSVDPKEDYELKLDQLDAQMLGQITKVDKLIHQNVSKLSKQQKMQQKGLQVFDFRIMNELLRLRRDRDVSQNKQEVEQRIRCLETELQSQDEKITIEPDQKDPSIHKKSPKRKKPKPKRHKRKAIKRKSTKDSNPFIVPDTREDMIDKSEGSQSKRKSIRKTMKDVASKINSGTHHQIGVFSSSEESVWSINSSVQYSDTHSSIDSLAKIEQRKAQDIDAMKRSIERKVKAKLPNPARERAMLRKQFIQKKYEELRAKLTKDEKASQKKLELMEMKKRRRSRKNVKKEKSQVVHSPRSREWSEEEGNASGRNQINIQLTSKDNVQDDVQKSPFKKIANLAKFMTQPLKIRKPSDIPGSPLKKKRTQSPAKKRRKQLIKVDDQESMKFNHSQHLTQGEVAQLKNKAIKDQVDKLHKQHDKLHSFSVLHSGAVAKATGLLSKPKDPLNLRMTKIAKKMKNVLKKPSTNDVNPKNLQTIEQEHKQSIDSEMSMTRSFGMTTTNFSSLDATSKMKATHEESDRDEHSINVDDLNGLLNDLNQPFKVQHNFSIDEGDESDQPLVSEQGEEVNPMEEVKQDTIETTVDGRKQRTDTYQAQGVGFTTAIKQLQSRNQYPKMKVKSQKQYFLKCEKNEHVNAVNIFTKITKNKVYLDNYKLNDGICAGLSLALGLIKDDISSLTLIDNGMIDERVAVILEGLQGQQLKQITIKSNEIGPRVVEQLAYFLDNAPPHHLEQVYISNCKPRGSSLYKFLQAMNQKKSKIKVLNFSNTQFAHLKKYDSIKVITDILQNCKELQCIDLSWNDLLPSQLKVLFEQLLTTRRLQQLNLSWNHMDCNDTRLSLLQNMRFFIRLNQDLQHLDLSNCSLVGEHVVKVAHACTKSLSLLAVHLSGNHVEDKQIDRIKTMLKCSSKLVGLDKDQIEHVNNVVKAKLGKKTELIDSIQLKDINQQKKSLCIPDVKTSGPMLNFNRIIEHFEIMGRSPYWIHQEHCWICQKSIYSILMWSESIAEDLPVVSPEKIGASLINQMKKDYQASGDFTDWTLDPMITMYQFCSKIDPEFTDPLSLYEGIKVEDFNATQLEMYNLLVEKYKRKYSLYFSKVINEDLPYSNPFYSLFPYNGISMSDTYYVYNKFIAPGRHRYLIYVQQPDGSDKFYGHSFVAPLRSEDLLLCKKRCRKKSVKRMFVKATSVFKEWKDDTDKVLAKSLNNDLLYWKIPRFVKDIEDQNDCKSVLMRNIHHIKQLFMQQVSVSLYPTISWIDFTNFTNEFSIIDKNCGLSTVDRLFITTNVTIEKMEDNPERELTRYEFYEILVRLAAAKYKDPGITETYAEALQMLIDECIMPHMDIRCVDEFRKRFVWTLEVNDILEANLETLRTLYQSYFTQNKKYFALEDAYMMLMRDLNTGLQEKDIVMAFGLSKMTIINEIEHRAQYKKLAFCEFLEFICRVAELKYRYDNGETLEPPTECRNMPKLLEAMLDLLLTLVNKTRKEMIFEFDFDASDSDEEIFDD